MCFFFVIKSLMFLSSFNKSTGKLKKNFITLWLSNYGLSLDLAARFVSDHFRRKASVSEMLHNLSWQSLDGRQQDQCLVLFY